MLTKPEEVQVVAQEVDPDKEKAPAQIPIPRRSTCLVVFYQCSQCFRLI